MSVKRKWRQPMHESRTNTVFSLPLQRLTGRTNSTDFQIHSLPLSHSSTLSLSLLFPGFPPSLPTRLQMADAILDVCFLHIKPEVTAAPLPNQPQMCRHSYLTTGADGTLSRGWKWKAQKTQVLFSQTLLWLPGENHRDQSSRIKTNSPSLWRVSPPTAAGALTARETLCRREGRGGRRNADL